MNIDWRVIYLFGIAIITTITVILIIRAHNKDKIKLDIAIVTLVALLVVTWIIPALDTETRKNILPKIFPLRKPTISAQAGEQECDYIWDGQGWNTSMSDETRSQIECPENLPKSPCDAYRLGIAKEKCLNKVRHRRK